MVTKAEIRQGMLAQRLKLNDGVRLETAERFMHKALAFLEDKNYQTIAGYYPVRGEVDILPLLSALKDQGKTVLLPRVNEKGGMLSFHEYSSLHFEKGAYGILQPVAENPAHSPDIILTPLVAFDSRGYRLGYGGGYYDRTLASMAEKPLLVGCAYRFQHVEALPIEPHDVALDAVIAIAV